MPQPTHHPRSFQPTLPSRLETVPSLRPRSPVSSPLLQSVEIDCHFSNAGRRSSSQNCHLVSNTIMIAEFGWGYCHMTLFTLDARATVDKHSDVKLRRRSP